MDLLSASSAVAQSLLHPKSAAAATTSGASGASGTSGSSSAASASGNGTITSSDFLTLLVTEMKNQDPTQPTDPNAYIQQLVGVNSLQELISINQSLSGLGTGTGTGTTATGVTSVTGTEAS